MGRNLLLFLKRNQPTAWNYGSRFSIAGDWKPVSHSFFFRVDLLDLYLCQCFRRLGTPVIQLQEARQQPTRDGSSGTKNFRRTTGQYRPVQASLPLRYRLGATFPVLAVETLLLLLNRKQDTQNTANLLGPIFRRAPASARYGAQSRPGSHRTDP